MTLTRYGLLLGSLLFQAGHAAPPPLRVALCECYVPPVLEWNALHQPRRGLIVELYQLIGKELQRQVEWKVLPRIRYDPYLRDGQLDLACYLAPQWTSLNEHELSWSKPIFTQRERVLMRKPQASGVTRLEQLHGKTLGLLRGYVYPELDPLLGRNLAHEWRELDHYSTFRLVENARIDAAVSPEMFAEYFLSERPGLRQKLALAPLVLNSTPVSCAAPRRGNLPGGQLERALQRLQDSGQLDQLRRRYHVPPNFILLAALLSIAISTGHAETLRSGICDCHALPLVGWQDSQQPSGGLLPELYQLLGKELERKPAWQVISRIRYDWALEHGKVDLICNYSPNWSKLGVSQVHWSAPLYLQRDRLLVRRHAAWIPERLAELNGLRIALVRGFRYPALDSIVAHNPSRMLYELNDTDTFRLVERGVADVAVSAELFIHHYLRQQAARSRQLRIAPLILSETPIHCALSHRSNITAKQFDQAVQRLQQQGKLTTLLMRYGVPAAPH